MSHPPRVCVAGSANMDLTFRTTRLPRPGETLTGQSFRTDFGGKGANQAVAAARLGARVSLVACLGDDPFGRQTLDHHRTEGIDVTHIRLDPDHPTGTAAIIVDDAAQNCILVVSGANSALSPEDVHAAASVIQEADVLLCQLEVPLGSVLEAFRLARAAGVRTLLTPAPAVELPDELYRLCDLCVPNETEAELLTGHEPEAAAMELRRRGVGAVVVTLGARGALLRDADGGQHIPAMTVEAVDPTGAGDAFTAALAVFAAEGLPLREAARSASTAAALTVTRHGAQSAFPARTHVEAMTPIANRGTAP